jgi:hypothetical protein
MALADASISFGRPDGRTHETIGGIQSREPCPAPRSAGGASYRGRLRLSAADRGRGPGELRSLPCRSPDGVAGGGEHHFLCCDVETEVKANCNDRLAEAWSSPRPDTHPALRLFSTLPRPSGGRRRLMRNWQATSMPTPRRRRRRRLPWLGCNTRRGPDPNAGFEERLCRRPRARARNL